MRSGKTEVRQRGGAVSLTEYHPPAQWAIQIGKQLDKLCALGRRAPLTDERFPSDQRREGGRTQAESWQRQKREKEDTALSWITHRKFGYPPLVRSSLPLAFSILPEKNAFKNKSGFTIHLCQRGCSLSLRSTPWEEQEQSQGRDE